MTVSPAALSIEEKGLLASKTVISADELEDLDVGENPNPRSITYGVDMVVARSDKAQTAFGAGLSLGELRHLQGLIHAVLSSNGEVLSGFGIEEL